MTAMYERPVLFDSERKGASNMTSDEIEYWYGGSMTEQEAIAKLTAVWRENMCGDAACGRIRLAAAIKMLTGSETHHSGPALTATADGELSR